MQGAFGRNAAQLSLLAGCLATLLRTIRPPGLRNIIRRPQFSLYRRCRWGVVRGLGTMVRWSDGPMTRWVRLSWRASKLLHPNSDIYRCITAQSHGYAERLYKPPGRTDLDINPYICLFRRVEWQPRQFTAPRFRPRSLLAAGAIHALRHVWGPQSSVRPSFAKLRVK